MHTRKHALKLLRQLPADIQDLLYRPKYWDEVFCDVYLDHCEAVRFRDPQAGLRLSQIAPELTRRTADLRRRTTPELQELRLRAQVVLAAAYRATSQVAEADATYDTAMSLSEAEGIPEVKKAELYLRLAVLRAWQKRFDEALELVGQASAIYEAAGDEHGLGIAFSTLGYAYNESGDFSEAIPNHGEALKRIDPKRDAQAERTYHATIHNMAFATCQTSSSKDLATARSYLREARRHLRDHRRSLPKYKLYWVEGMLLIKVGLTRRGEKLLDTARHGCLLLDAPWEIALVSLELSALYHLEGRWADLKTLARETYDRFRELSADTEAITALSLWNDAVMIEALTDEVISAAKERIEGRMRYRVLS